MAPPPVKGARTEQDGHDAAIPAGINKGRALKVAY